MKTSLKVLITGSLLVLLSACGGVSTNGSYREQAKLTLAVVPFTEIPVGTTTGHGLGIAESLSSDFRMHFDGLWVVERGQLETILEEIKLSLSDLVDPAYAVQAGRLIGANYLVLGSYQEIDGKAMVVARLVHVETGQVISSAKDWGNTNDLFELEKSVFSQLKEDLPCCE